MKKAIFDEYDEIFEEMLVAEVVLSLIGTFVDEEVGELWEVVSIGMFWISENFCESDLVGKFRLSWSGGECIGRYITGIILLQEGIRIEKYKFFFAFVLSEENDWEGEVYFDKHEEEELEDEL